MPGAPALELVRVAKDFPVEQRIREVLRAPFRRPWRRVLHDVSVEVHPGEVVVLLGPNGSGKSTCLHLLAGLLRPTSGVARVLGVDTAEDPDRARRGLGFVSASDRGFHAQLSVRENLRFYAALQDLRGPPLDVRLRELAADLDAEDLLERPFRVLSTGQRTRVALARALLHRPRVLLLDEATRALDPGAARRFRERVVRDLAGREGLAVLYTSHDLAEAEQIANRAVLLAEGRVVAAGAWADVKPAFDTTFFAEEAG